MKNIFFNISNKDNYIKNIIIKYVGTMNLQGKSREFYWYELLL